MPKKEWFAEWFDTPYYHILYQNRGEEEARGFIKALLSKLNLPLGASLLDLACGKGRHSITLNSYGFDVLGVDLSSKSISSAKRYENSNLSFEVQDMREPIEGKKFDAIFNLFTSFGYFDTQKENEKVCKAMAQMLNQGGRLVIDFMNAKRVISGLVPFEKKVLNDIEFNISREYTGTHIIKTISFNDKSELHRYQEKVQTIGKEQFKELLSPYFYIDFIFGSFDLDDYSPTESERLIIVATRK